MSTKCEEEKMMQANEKEDSFFNDLKSLETTSYKHHDRSRKSSLECESSQKELELFHYRLDYNLRMIECD